MLICFACVNSSVFMHPNGSLKVAGDLIIQSSLAHTYKKIADGGAKEFYNGSLAKKIINDIEDGRGDSIITLDDLNSYK